MEVGVEVDAGLGLSLGLKLCVELDAVPVPAVDSNFVVELDSELGSALCLEVFGRLWSELGFLHNAVPGSAFRSKLGVGLELEH